MCRTTRTLDLGRAAGKAANPGRAIRPGLKATFSYVALTNVVLWWEMYTKELLVLLIPTHYTISAFDSSRLKR